MRTKSEASALGIKAPKSTYEKNICLFLKRSNDESTIDALCEKFNENRPIIVGLLNNMQKSGLVSMNGDVVYLLIKLAE